MIYLFLTLFNASIGEKFCNNGDRYEGEWKDDKIQGLGKKSDLSNDVLMLT